LSLIMEIQWILDYLIHFGEGTQNYGMQK